MMKIIKITLKSILLLLSIGGIACNNNAMKRGRAGDRLSQAPVKKAKRSNELNPQLYDTVGIGDAIEIEPALPASTSSNSSSSNTIRLELLDGCVDFPKDLCVLSTTIQNMIDDFPGNTDPIPLPNITMEYWNLLYPVLKNLYNLSMNKCTIDEIGNQLNSYTLNNLVKIFCACDFLDIRIQQPLEHDEIELLDLTGQAIARKLLEPENLKLFFKEMIGTQITDAETLYDKTGLKKIAPHLSRYIAQQIIKFHPKLMHIILNARNSSMQNEDKKKKYITRLYAEEYEPAINPSGDMLITDYEPPISLSVAIAMPTTELDRDLYLHNTITDKKTKIFDRELFHRIIFGRKGETIIFITSSGKIQTSTLTDIQHYTEPNSQRDYIYPEGQEPVELEDDDQFQSCYKAIINSNKNMVLTLAEDVYGNPFKPKMFNLKTDESIDLNQQAIMHAEFNDNGDTLAIIVDTGIVDTGTIKIINTKNGQCLHELNNQVPLNSSLSFNKAGDQIVCISSTGQAQVWNVRTGLLLYTIGHDLSTACFDNSGTKIIAEQKKEQKIEIWNALKGDLLHIIEGSLCKISVGKNICKSIFSRTGNLMITINDKNAEIWNINTKTCLHTLKGHPDKIISTRFNSDGDKIVTKSEQSTRIWDVQTGLCISILEEKKEPHSIHPADKLENQTNHAMFCETSDKVISWKNDVYCDADITIYDLKQTLACFDYFKKHLTLDQALFLACLNHFVKHGRPLTFGRDSHLHAIFNSIQNQTIKQRILFINQQIQHAIRK